MRLRHLFLFGVLVAACIPSWVSAQEARTAAPLLVRVHSLDEAKTDVGYFGKMIGREEIAALVNLIPVPVVDTAEPFGLYAHVGAKPADSALVGMLPIVSEKQFVNTLAQFKIKLTKLDGGSSKGSGPSDFGPRTTGSEPCSRCRDHRTDRETGHAERCCVPAD